MAPVVVASAREDLKKIALSQQGGLKWGSNEYRLFIPRALDEVRPKRMRQNKAGIVKLHFVDW